MVDHQHHHQRHHSSSSQLSRKSLQTFQPPNNTKSNNNRLSQGSLNYDMSTNTAVTSPTTSLPDRPSLIPRHSKTNSYSSTTSSTSRNLSLAPSSPSKIPKPTLRHLNSHPSTTASNKNPKVSTQHQKKSGMVNNISNEGEGREYPITPSDSHLVVPSLVTNSSTSDSLLTTNGLPTNVIPLGTPVETSKEKLSGILRFVGATQFKEGTWAGIELHEKGKGKNDGSINGVRYFSCAPQSGIFVNYLAVRPSKLTVDPSKLSADKSSRSRLLTPDQATQSPSSPQPRKLPPAYKNRLNKVQTGSRQTLNSQPSTTASHSYGLRDKPSRSSLASSHHRNLRNATEPVPIDQPLEALLDLTPQGKFEDATDIDELFSLPNNNPSLVIKNLLSQLNTQRKENDLLRIRINKKRARIEATRVLKTEFIDKARQEIFSRRLSQNLHAADEPKSKAIQDQEEIIREISLKISQNDIEIDALKARACEIPLFTNDGDAQGEMGSPHQLERMQLDLQDLQGQLTIKEKLLTELKGEMDSFHLIIMSYSQQRDSSTVKSRLNEIMHELESLRDASVVEAASLRNEIDQLHSQLQKYSESGTGEQHQLDLTSKYHQLLESLEVANRRHQESDLKLQEYQRSQEALVSEHQTKLQECIDKIDHLTRENSELQQQLTALQADASDLAELKKELADNQVTIDNLNHDIDELHQYIEEVTQNQEGYEEGGITPTMYEELKTEKDHYVTSLETIQKEKNELLIQMQALKAALYKLEEVSYRENEKSDSLDSEKTVIPDPNLGKLEARIRQLEDELVTAKSINQKIKEGTLTQDDLHDSLTQDLQARDTTIIRLESELKEAEGYIQELIKENDGLITDNKAFEEDNWRLDDMYNEVTKELVFKTKEANEYKDKVGLLKEALEAAAQTSDSARKMNELMLKVDEIEAYFNSEIDTLLKDLTEFDEDLKAAGKREETLLSEIQSLKQRLSHPYATDHYANLSDEELDADALNALDLGDKTICHLCLGDHDPELCPDPMALANDEAAVLELEGLLDDSYDLPDPTPICSDCQEPGHSYEHCPNSAEVY